MSPSRMVAGSWIFLVVCLPVASVATKAKTRPVGGDTAGSFWTAGAVAVGLGSFAPSDRELESNTGDVGDLFEEAGAGGPIPPCSVGPKPQVGEVFVLVVVEEPKPKRGGVRKEGILLVSRVDCPVVEGVASVAIAVVGTVCRWVWGTTYFYTCRAGTRTDNVRLRKVVKRRE